MMIKKTIPIDLEEAIAAFGVTLDDFSRHTGICISHLIDSKDNKDYSRCNDILAILNKLQAWFDSAHQCWIWYIKQQIPGFGDASAAEIVKNYDDKGVVAVNSYIASKEGGGFE